MLLNKWELSFGNNEFLLKLDERDTEERILYTKPHVAYTGGRSAFIYFPRRDAEQNERFKKILLDHVMKEFSKELTALQTTVEAFKEFINA